MIHSTIFVSVDLDILLAARKLQPGITVFFGVYVAGTAHREQGVEFYIIGFIWCYTGEPFVIAEYDLLSVLTPAHIDSLPLDPPFSTDFLGNFAECLVAIFTMVIYYNVLRAVNLTYLPVCDVPRAISCSLHDHMFSRWRGQCEYGVVLAIDTLQHKQILEQALNAVEFDVVNPLKR